jgi:hypothetical protein
MRLHKQHFKFKDMLPCQDGDTSSSVKNAEDHDEVLADTHMLATACRTQRSPVLSKPTEPRESGTGRKSRIHTAKEAEGPSEEYRIVMQSTDEDSKSIMQHRMQSVESLVDRKEILGINWVVKEIFCSTTKLSFWCRKITRKAFVSHQNPSP